ncbi:MAG: hypothetical protein IJZ78_01060 [Alistipes sp.]|nr:hypothetical protein [Alistipes sp.]
MRRIATLLIALFSFATLFAQQPQKVYCTITSSSSVTNVSTYAGSISVNYGQESLYKSHLVDQQGKRIVFSSMIAALNHMAQYGWELVSTETKYERSLLDDRKFDKIVSVWILSKMVTDRSQITEGFTTRLMYEDSVSNATREP